MNLCAHWFAIFVHVSFNGINTTFSLADTVNNKSWISAGDFSDLRYKIGQAGFLRLLSRLRISGLGRTVSKWDNVSPGADFWIIPAVRRRWNEKCTGAPDKEYEDYVVETLPGDKTGLKMLSVGCGTGARERKFGRYCMFSSIEGIDVAATKIAEARQTALAEGYSNISYRVADFRVFDHEEEYYDIILFNSSLHHFNNVDLLIRNKVLPLMKNGGMLVIFEYVGPRRLQWTDLQLETANTVLQQIPEKYKRKFNSHSVKKRIYRPGWIRMYLNDPSEAADSEMIIPSIHRYFNIVEEKHVGWDILHCLLKDISHNFLDEDQETLSLLRWLFDEEDRYMKETGRSDAIFGIYQKP